MTLFLRRIAAYLIDSITILAYLAAFTGIVLVTGLSLDMFGRLGQWVAIAVGVTLPVIVFFSMAEWLMGRSPGKWALGLEVRTQSSDMRPAFLPALLRNGVKFLPWEIAHAGIWTIPGQPFIDPPAMHNIALFVLSWSVVLVQIGLVAMTGRGIHDRAAGLLVVRRKPTPDAP